MSYNKNNPRTITPSTTQLNSNYSTKSKPVIICPEVSPVTKQEFRDECDINTIMSRYQFNGEMPVLNQRSPQYLDTTGIEFQEAMEFVAGAQTLFNELPSALRNRFSNDPAQFLDFTSNENNRSEMEELGLLKPKHLWSIPTPNPGGISPQMPQNGPNVPNSTSPINSPPST